MDYSYSKFIDTLTTLKTKFNRPFQEVALQYNLAHSSAAPVIVGASPVKQLQDNTHGEKQRKG